MANSGSRGGFRDLMPGPALQLLRQCYPLTWIMHEFSAAGSGSSALTRLYARGPRSSSEWHAQRNALSERMIPTLQPKTRALSGLGVCAAGNLRAGE